MNREFIETNALERQALQMGQTMNGLQLRRKNEYFDASSPPTGLSLALPSALFVRLRLQIVDAELTRFTESSPLVTFIALIATYAW
jgi:hypothetical protein